MTFRIEVYWSTFRSDAQRSEIKPSVRGNSGYHGHHPRVHLWLESERVRRHWWMDL